MIISRAEIQSAVSAVRTERKRKATRVDAVPHDSSDMYVSSTAAASIAELSASVAAEPLYREALVNELQRRVASGKYFVPAEHIVEKLLGRLVLEALPA